MGLRLPVGSADILSTYAEVPKAELNDALLDNLLGMCIIVGNDFGTYISQVYRQAVAA